jgi:hypothetical protein
MDENVFFQSIGLHVLSKVKMALKVPICVLGCWLIIYSMKAPFIDTAASLRQNEWQAFWMYSILLLAGLILRQWTDLMGSQISMRHRLDVHLQNAADREFQHLQVLQI